MSKPSQSRERLDSWKAIAEYLKRDLATVRRWEKGLGLPVHRVGGSGRSVFAYPSEIDDWLLTAKPALPNPITTRLGTTATVRVRGHSLWLLLSLIVAVLVASVYGRPRPVAAGDLHVVVTPGALIARNAAGLEQWRHAFTELYKNHLPSVPVQVTGGAAPGVYFATSYRARQNESDVEGGVLSFFDLTGRPQRSFSFGDRVTFDGVGYGAPWVITAFAVNEADGSNRVAVTAHHFTWDPGLVTVLDNQWRRMGTFVHAGWLEQVRWLGADRLLVAGFSNAYDGGMVALVDPAALDGQGPAPPHSRHVCDDCGTARPLRLLVFPRTELNRVSGSPFNRVILYTSEGLVSARTIEMTTDRGDADVVYELKPSLDLVSAQFSERYWDMHRALEVDGRMTHGRDQCPDRDGPREIQMWEPATGWRTVEIR